jgi:hypothetical protein
LVYLSLYFRKLQDVQLEAFHLSQSIVQAGFNITRLKIEAMISNVGVPQTEADASSLSSENYFEFHIKLLLPSGADLSSLKQICTENSAHLSNNVFKILSGGMFASEQKHMLINFLLGFTHRFVTLRLYGVGKLTAEEKFNSCVFSLDNAGYSITSKMREYAVYDTNVSLDSGWIDRNTPIETVNILI